MKMLTYKKLLCICVLGSDQALPTTPGQTAVCRARGFRYTALLPCGSTLSYEHTLAFKSQRIKNLKVTLKK